MPFSDFFRRWFFGPNGNEPKSDNFEDQKHHRHNFRNPIWQNDDDDDDGDDFGRRGNGIHFTIDSDPVEIAKFFESEMDNFFKSFMFGASQNPFSFFTGPEFGMGMSTLPAIEGNEQNSNLRDQVLKPGLQETVEPERRLDGDIDGKLSAEELGKIWGAKNDPSTMPLVPFEPVQPRPEQRGLMPQTRFGEGHIMKRHIVTDSQGNIKTTCTRQIGGKTHTVTTVKDKNGVETRTESLINMNEDDLDKFNEVWNGMRGSRNSQNFPKNPSGSFDGIDWKEYFDPKL